MALEITPAQRAALEAVMDRTDEAFEDGFSDGSEAFSEALINDAAGPSPVTPELRVKLQEFVATVVAATMSAGVGTSDPFVSEAEYGRACGANFTSSGSPSNTSGCTFLVTGRPMSRTSRSNFSAASAASASSALPT